MTTGIFTFVEPRHVKAARDKNDWRFANYMETPSDREDGMWYVVFLFRDSGRKIFGAQEFLSGDLPRVDIRDWATRVLTDTGFRERWHTDEARVIGLWRKR